MAQEPVAPAAMKILQDQTCPSNVTCWSCGIPADRDHSMCGACGKMLLLAEGKSYFAMLGLPDRYVVSLPDLEQNFHRMSRLWHPDRFGTASSSALERRLAVQRTTLLNDAYRSLRDTVKRAEYLLQREGAQRGEESGTKDPELLMEIMEGRERVEELKDAVRAMEPGALESLRALRAEFDGKVAALFTDLDALFARHDGGDKTAVPALRSTVDRMRYFNGIKAELDQLALGARQLA